jgi:D-alanyl-D-alanine carboxypeptidase/D-alanyl-D-alanine-endopeptidase (penicillin-binding protein 4)
MKKVFLLVAGCGILVACSFAQTVSQKLQKAFQQFESDSQLRHAISSLYVIDAKTGDVVFERNAQVGLAPASTQKIITSVTAFELLGKEYRYKTVFSMRTFNSSSGRLVIYPSGDPTFGSWRFQSTTDTTIFDNLIKEMRSYNYSSFNNINILTQTNSRGIPSGWIFEDIGNYYGAASYDLNWGENQFDFVLKPGKKIGEPTELIRNKKDSLIWKYVENECKTGPAGSGDNAYIYFVPGQKMALIQGTIPMGVNQFKISGADIDPVNSFSVLFSDYAASKGIKSLEKYATEMPWEDSLTRSMFGLGFYTHYSPYLDSIIYWFNKKSINLYGEALVKTFAWEKTGFGSTDTGVAIVKKFWKEKGLDEEELNIYDGSGLSPLNRVTTHAQVEILKYAKTKDWFPSFYDALPEYNGMKMKSGTISDVKGFCGYHTAKDGKEYIFSFLVNNYSSRASQLLSKMYKVLDLLK